MKKLLFGNFRNVGAYHQKLYAVQLLTIIGLYIVPLHYALLSLLILFPVWQLVYIIMHDYISHQYIEPKNKIVQFLSLMFITILTGEALLDKKNYHMAHHTRWNTEKDPTYSTLKNHSLFVYLFDFYQTPLSPIEHTINKLPNNIELWINANATIIFYLGIVVSFIFMPLWLFFVLHVYLRFLLTLLGHLIDFYYHKIPDDDISKDIPFLTILLGGGAAHIYHHKYFATADYGRGYWKYLNLGWYITKIGFNNTAPK